MLVCEICHGSNIETKMWVDPNTQQVGDAASDGEDDDNYCNDCQMHVGFIEENKFKKSSDAPEFIQKIDWTLLREQKANLIQLFYHTQDDYPHIVEPCEGITDLIDAIQDYAVDVMGLSEKEVFNLTPEDGE